MKNKNFPKDPTTTRINSCDFCCVVYIWEKGSDIDLAYRFDLRKLQIPDKQTCLFYDKILPDVIEARKRKKKSWLEVEKEKELKWVRSIIKKVCFIFIIL